MGVNIFSETQVRECKPKPVQNSQSFFDCMRNEYEKENEKNSFGGNTNGNNIKIEHSSEQIQKDLKTLSIELDERKEEQKPTMSEKVHEMLLQEMKNVEVKK